MKKNFKELRSQMGEARVARSKERAQEMLDELLAEGLESGESVPVDNAYWMDLRKRVADRQVGDGIKGAVFEGPGLHGVDFDRDQSPMRDAEL